MAIKTIKTVIQLRRGTTANWEVNKTTIPAPGEPCFDTELYTLRIGDGTTTYENLPSIGASASTGSSRFEIVDTVPSAADAESDVLYLVKNTTTGSYDIYALVDGSVVQLDDTSVDLPGATMEKLGMVKGSDAENGVAINDDYTMTVNSINVNKLVQTDGDEFVIDGGSAS